GAGHDRFGFRREEDVDPVVVGVVGVGREGPGAAVFVEAVAAFGVGQHFEVALMQDRGAGGRRVAHLPGGVGVVPVGGEVGGDVGRVRLDVHRAGEFALLPAGGRFAFEGRFAEQLAADGPQRTDMGAGVGRRFVEADAVDRPRDVAADLYADRDRAVVTGVGDGRGTGAQHRAGAGDRDFAPGACFADVGGVVDPPGLDRRRALGADVPGVGPAGGAGRRVPGFAAVGRDFDPGDDAAPGVFRGAADRHRFAAFQLFAGGRRGDGRGRRGVVGRFGRRDQVRLQGRRLGAHFGEQVDGRLLHVH